MRIDCDQCSAAFTIDDALISERGVRAQCPKCGFQKIVKKVPDSASAPPTVPYPFTPPASPFASPATDPFAGLQAASPSPNPLGAANPFSTAPRPFAAGQANPFGTPANPFGGVPVPVANPFSAPATAPTPPPAAPSNPFAVLPGTGANLAPGFGGNDPFARLATGPDPFGRPATPLSTSPDPFVRPAPSAAASSADPFAKAGADPFAKAGADPFAKAGADPFAPKAGADPFAKAGADPFAPKAGASSPDPFARPATAASNDPFAKLSDDPFGRPPSASTDPFGRPPVPSSSPDPFGRPPSASPDPFGRPPVPSSSPDPFGRPPSASTDPFGRPPVPSSSPSGQGDPFAAKPSAQGDPFANLGTGGSSEAQPADRFSKPAPDDPFASVSIEGPPKPPPPAASSAAGQWALKTSSGAEVMDLTQLRDRVKSGAVRADAKAAPTGEPFKAISDWPLLAVALPGKKEDKSRASGARAAGLDFSVPKPLLGAVIAIAVVAGVGVATLKFKPQWFEDNSEFGVNPLRRAEGLWRRQFPDPDGTAEEHLIAGRKHMRLDTAPGYRKADDELRQALLLDVGNVRAIAAWAENFAQLPTVRADLEGSTLAQEALDYGLKREPENVDVLRAQAALKLALGSVDDAQRFLAMAKKIAPNDVDTLVVLARSNLERNPADALSIIQRSVRPQNPELKVAYVIEGGAQRRLGAFKEARELLQTRLASDANNVGALKEMAKLELDLGHADAAVVALNKLLDAEDKDVEAHLLRAKINYQIKGGVEGLKLADAQLTEVLAKHEGAAGDLLLSILAHAAFVKTQLGDVDAAITLGERARATDAGHPSALFVLGRAYAQKGDLDNARKTLEQAVQATEKREEFYEPLVRSELAVVQARAGDEENAIRNNEKVIDADPRNIRAHFSLASIYVKNQKFIQAMTIMRRVLSSDPAWEKDRLLPTDFPLRAADLNAFADAFRDAKTAKDDQSLLSLKYSSEGIIRYHAGERARAEQLFQVALKEDRYNHAALLYLSAMNMEDGEYAEPKRRLKLAVDTTAASHPITRLYLARAEMLTGDDGAARTLLADLTETEPTLVQARYSLAMVLRKLKLEAEATTELRAIVRQDPDYLPAKQALAGP